MVLYYGNMQKFKVIWLVLCVFTCVYINAQTTLLEGDILFQETSSDFSDAIKIATGSKYSHCGIVLKHNGKLMVFEAVQPVKFTPLTEWINRGVNQHYVVKRLFNRDSVLTDTTLHLMYNAVANYINKPYDVYFQWSNARIYCSELVFKLYQVATGLQVGTFQGFNEFYTEDALVKQQMQKIYGTRLPVSEQFVSPLSVMQSNLLIEVE